MYSQNDEESHILKFFGGFVGRFLDVGAHDGRTFSNTRRLAERGWGGVCVEPSPTVFPALAALYQGDPKVQCVQVAVAPFQGTFTMYDAGGDLVSTFDPLYRDRWASSGVRYREVPVKVISWQALLRQVGTDFEFINLDIEALSAKVFHLIDPAQLPSLKLICVEHDFQGREIAEAWSHFGFRLIAETAENVLLGR